MSERCPTCKRPVSRPLASERLTSWTDECACSDYSPCVAHQCDALAGPDRPTADVMRERTAVAHRARLLAHEQIVERCRAATLTTDDRAALLWLAMQPIRVANEQERATCVRALEVIERLTKETT